MSRLARAVGALYRHVGAWRSTPDDVGFSGRRRCLTSPITSLGFSDCARQTRSVLRCDGMELDDAISALEALAVKLESADSSFDDRRLNEAIGESVSVADAVLSPQDSSMWRELTKCVNPNKKAAASSIVKACSSTPEPPVDRCSNSRCGILCTDEDLKRKCALGCGVRFCNSHCWRERRAYHEGTCSVLQKKAILRKLRIDNVEADELF